MSSTITALYDNRADAEAAKERLRTASIDVGQVQIHDQASPGYDDTQYSTHQNRGIWDSIKHAFLPDEDRHTYEEGMRRGGALLTVDVEDAEADAAMQVLEQDANSVDIDERANQWRSSGWNYPGSGGMPATNDGTIPESHPTILGGASFDAEAGRGLQDDILRTDSLRESDQAGLGGASFEAERDRTPKEDTSRDQSLRDATLQDSERRGDVSAEREEVVPIVEEQLVVGKRDVNRGGVRVRSYVTEVPVHEQIRLRNEQVQVERRKVDQPLSDADGDAFRERTIDVTATGQEAVVSKTARVVEEVVVSKTAQEHDEQIDDSVRHTDVEIDRNGEDVERSKVGTESTDKRI